uniref:(northern house mosquito) hypothetical protein n=1 Tax=Culex pipiens TaxID=7175 RepID=A0A8D8K2E5_CULPI
MELLYSPLVCFQVVSNCLCWAGDKLLLYLLFLALFFVVIVVSFNIAYWCVVGIGFSSLIRTTLTPFGMPGKKVTPNLIVDRRDLAVLLQLCSNQMIRHVGWQIMDLHRR